MKSRTSGEAKAVSAIICIAGKIGDIGSIEVMIRAVIVSKRVHSAAMRLNVMAGVPAHNYATASRLGDTYFLGRGNAQVGSICMFREG